MSFFILYIKIKNYLMFNSKPNNAKYNQGNYIPKYPEKLIKLNNEGGIYFRSGLEKKIMVWMDMNVNIIQWGAECLEIPYQLTHFDKGDAKIKNHRYFPDFYYKIKKSSGIIEEVVMEAKPYKDYENVIKLDEGRLSVPENGLKKLKNFEYDLKEASRNREKWNAMIAWCNKKGIKFIVVTEKHLQKLNL